MGQKVNPHGYRVGINKTWDSNWIADKKHVAAYILEDKKINIKIVVFQKLLLKEKMIQNC